MINKRIRAIAQLIENDKSVIDIGCDHGYLAKQLRIQGNNNLIICCDEKIGPLNNAKSNLEKYDNIDFFCTDGVENIQKQADVAVMAGMGHHTVEHIMLSSESYFRNCKKIIIQVNQTVSLMRKFLMKNNYSIVDEIIIKDYKYYEILCIENGKQYLTAEQIEFGPILMQKNNDIFRQYYLDQIKHIDIIQKNMDINHPDRKQLDDRKEMIYKMLSSNSL